MPKASRQEAVLTSDLWAKVLSHLNPASRPHLLLACMHGFRSYTQSRLVNKQFSQLFEEHLELASCTYLRRHFAQEALPSLLQWLQKRGRTSTHLVSECGSPCTEAALTALISSASGLSTVIIHKASDYSISILSMFTSLTRCELTAAYSNLNLGALQTLAGLNVLELRHGSFSNLDQLANLTELRLVSGDIVSTRECRFTSSLQKLYMWDSLLSGTHAVGLGGFTALTLLHCNGSAVRGTNERDKLNTSKTGPIVPADLSSLTQLTVLCLTFTCSMQTLDLQGVYLLSSLEVLELMFHSDAFVQLSSSLACLKTLKTLAIYLYSRVRVMSGSESPVATVALPAIGWTTCCRNTV